MILLIIIGYAVLAVYEFVPLYKEKQSKELLVNGTLFILSFLTVVLISFDIIIPSPAVPIRNAITSIFGK
jgi:hypothetical protein